MSISVLVLCQVFVAELLCPLLSFLLSFYVLSFVLRQVSIARPKQTRESTRDANLYVADLPDSATEHELKQIFENYGKVYNCKLVVNAETGES